MPANLFQLYDGPGPVNRVPVTEAINKPARDLQLKLAFERNGAWKTDPSPHTSPQTVVLATAVAGPSWQPAPINSGPVEG